MKLFFNMDQKRKQSQMREDREILTLPTQEQKLKLFRKIGNSDHVYYC